MTLGAFLGTMCLSCTHHISEKVIFPQTDSVNINLLGDSSIIGMPLDMTKYDNLLLISDFHGDSLIWIFDISKNKMKKRWISKGKGPDEFLSPIQMVLTDSILAIQNRSQYSSRKYRINLSSLTLEGAEPLIRIPTGIDRLHPLNEGKYIASGIFEESRYAILNHDGEIVQYFGNYPNYKAGEDYIPTLPKFMFHQSMFTYHSHREKLASVTQHVLEIINFPDHQPQVEKQILLSPYDYYYTDGMQRADNFQIGAVFACSTHDYIYIIYNPSIVNGRSRKEYNNQVWIFDWNGNPVKKILPDLQITCMYVEDDNKTVYCMVNAPDPTIATFIIDL